MSNCSSLSLHLKRLLLDFLRIVVFIICYRFISRPRRVCFCLQEFSLMLILLYLSYTGSCSSSSCSIRLFLHLPSVFHLDFLVQTWVSRPYTARQLWENKMLTPAASNNKWRKKLVSESINISQPRRLELNPCRDADSPSLQWESATLTHTSESAVIHN